MANCKICGSKLSIFDIGADGVCVDCREEQALKFRENSIAAMRQKVREKAETAAQSNENIMAVLLTTETAPNLNITKRIEIVTAEVAYGMNIFKDLFAAVRDVVGGRSEAVQSTMRDARRTALYELKKEAYEVGANAVVGVDLDYVEISSNSNMIMLVASGTAVVIEEVKE